MTRKEHDIIYRLGSAGATARTGAPPVLEEATSGPAGVGPSGLPPMIASAIFEIAAWVRSLHSSQPNALAGYRLAGIDAVVAATGPPYSEAGMNEAGHVEAAEFGHPGGRKPSRPVCAPELERGPDTLHRRVLDRIGVLPVGDARAFGSEPGLAPRRIVAAPFKASVATSPSTLHEDSADGVSGENRLAMVADADGHPLIGAWARLAVAELTALPTAEARERWLACHGAELGQVREANPGHAAAIERTAATGKLRPSLARAAPNDGPLDPGDADRRYIRAARAELNRLLNQAAPQPAADVKAESRYRDPAICQLTTMLSCPHLGTRRRWPPKPR